MKKTLFAQTLSEQMMHMMRRRLRLPVIALMLLCNLSWSLQGYGQTYTAVTHENTRVIQLNGDNPTATLRPGMTVTGNGFPSGLYITQVLSGNQILVNLQVTTQTSIPLTFESVGEVADDTVARTNWTKTGVGRAVVFGNTSLAGNFTIQGGSVQLGGVSANGRTWMQDLIGNNTSVIMANDVPTTLDFANNRVAHTLFERIGSLATTTTTGNGATVNLTSGNTSVHLAVGGNNSDTFFRGNIKGDAASAFIKEGNGTMTWESDFADSLSGTVRVDSGTLSITGIEGLNSAAKVLVSNKSGASLVFNNNETIASMQGGGRGAMTSFSNGTLGALSGNYIGATGGSISVAEDMELRLENTLANASFGGVLTGGGSFVKAGNNVLELFGDSDYLGATTIQAVANNTTSMIRLGAYGISSGVGSLSSSGYGHLPGTTALELAATGAGSSAFFDLNGGSQTLSSLTSSGSAGTQSVLLNNGKLSINTLTGKSLSYGGNFQGNGTIDVLATIDTTQPGGWILTGNSNTTQTGSFNVKGGKVTLNGTIGTLGDRVHVTVANGAELIVKQSDTVGSLSGNGLVTVESGRTLTLRSAPVGGVASNPWSGTITGDGGLTLGSGASLLLKTAQAYNGATTLSMGSALYLDYGTGGTSPNLIPDTSPLLLNGGSIFISGTSPGQNVSAVTIGSGTTTISTQLGDSASKLHFNSLTRDTLTRPSGQLAGSGGGVLQIRGAAVTVGSAALPSGILGGYATYHAVDGDGNPVVSWAARDTNGKVVAFTDYITDYASTPIQDGHLDVTKAYALENPITGKVGSLRFNEAPTDNEEFKFYIDGSHADIQSGGILVTPLVGDQDVTIASISGSILTGGEGFSNYNVWRELIIHQHNTQGSLIIEAPIGNVPGTTAGGATRLTKTGQGKLILANSNTYSGQTSIWGGVLQLEGDNQASGNLGNSDLPVLNYGYLSFNQSSVDYALGMDITGTGVVRNNTTGTGGITLSGGNSNYTGTTQILSGKLSVNSNNALGSVDGLTSVSAGGNLEIRGRTIGETVVLKGGTLSSATATKSELSGALILKNTSTVQAGSTAPLIISGQVRTLPGATLSVSSNGIGGRVILTNSSNEIGNVNVDENTTFQIGMQVNEGDPVSTVFTLGSLGRGVINTEASTSNVVTATSNAHLVFGAKITGAGNFYQVRNTVYLTADNDYTGKTIVGGMNSTMVLPKLGAVLRVGADTYTGSVGTGDIHIDSGSNTGTPNGAATLAFNKLKSSTLANTIFLNPVLDFARSASFIRQSLGSLNLSGTINAGAHAGGAQRSILQSDAGGKLTISGILNNGESNRMNIVNNGFISFANTDSALNQEIWGVLSGGGAYTFKSAGTITLRDNSTFSGINFVKRGTVVVDSSAGLNNDVDMYIGRGAQLQFNQNDTVGLVLGQKGSVLNITNGSTLTMDDSGTLSNFGRITGEGTLIIAPASTSWHGFFGDNELASDAFIGAANTAGTNGVPTVVTSTVRVNNLSNSGEVSSLGMGSAINIGPSGLDSASIDSRLEYIGEGQATNRVINLLSTSGNVRIAGSGKGALILNGDIINAGTGTKTLYLHGQTTGNTVNGGILEGSGVLNLNVNAHPSGGNNDMYGHGHWKLTNRFNDFSGSVTVNLGVLELAGQLGDGTGTSSVFGDLTATRTVIMGSNNFDARRFDIFSGLDTLSAIDTPLEATGTILFNDNQDSLTTVFGSNITFRQNFSSTTLEGSAQLINNGTKVLVFNGEFQSGASGNRSWILDGTNTGANTINGVIQDTATTGTSDTVGVIKEGSGRWRLNGTVAAPNLYEGTTQIARGILELDGGYAVFDNGLVTLSNQGSDSSAVGGATLRILESETIGGLAGAYGTTVELADGKTLTVRSSTQVYNGFITGGGGFTRTNNDTTGRDSYLTNLNDYTGVTRIITNGSNAALVRINVQHLADGGEASGIGSSTSAASNLIMSSATGGGGLRWQGSTSQDTDRLFTLGAGTGAGAIWAEGQIFGDFAPVLHWTATDAFEFLDPASSRTLGLRGTTIAENRFDLQINDSSATGITSLTKSDAGMWLLTNANSNYSGVTTIANGTLAITNANALGNSSVTLAGGSANAGLLLRGSLNMDNNLTNTTTNGVLVAEGGQSTWSGGFSLSGTNSSLRVGIVAAADSLTILSGITGSLGSGRLVKYGRGTLTMSGENTYTGITSISGGKVVLDYATSNTSKLANGQVLELGFSGISTTGNTLSLGADNDVGGQSAQVAFAGGTLALSGGSHVEVVSATTINNGANRVIREGVGATSVLQMGAITRNYASALNSYGTIDFGAGGIATTTSTNVSTGGLLSATISGSTTASTAYATVGQTDWATVSSGSIVAYTAYGTTFASGVNTNITAADTNVLANASTNTIRFNTNVTGGVNTLTLAGILNLQSGGILVTPNVTDKIVIKGTAGSLRRSVSNSALDTVIHHYGSGDLVLDVPLTNNSGTTGQALTKTGKGTLVLTRANTLTGRITIQQGTLQLGDGTTVVGSPSTPQLGGVATGNTIGMADGTLLRINVANAAHTSFIGAMNGGGELRLAATNTSTLVLTGSSLDWVGDIYVDGGTLGIRGSNSLGSVRGAATFASGTALDIQMVGTSAAAITSAKRITFENGSTLKVTNDGTIRNFMATLSGVLTLQNTSAAGFAMNVANGQSLTISGMIKTANGFTKEGDGLLILSANQYQDALPGAVASSAGVITPDVNPALLGKIIVSDGELRLGNIRALGAVGLGNETEIRDGASLNLNGMAINFPDVEDPNREIIHIAGKGVNETGALKNTTGLGSVSTVIFDDHATMSGGGFVNGQSTSTTAPASSRLVIAGYDINRNTSTVAAGALLAGNYQRVEAVIDGNNKKLTIVGNSTFADATGAGVTFRDPKFTSALDSIIISEGTFRIDQEPGSGATFKGLNSANVTNGVFIGYTGATLADQTNASLGLGPNVGARLNFFRNFGTDHSVNITMNGITAAAAGGANYIDLGTDGTIPNPRTYLSGTVTLIGDPERMGDATRNFFHIDAANSTLTIGAQGNLTGAIQSKLIVTGQIRGTGGFTKTGLQELRLTADNDFTGALNVLRFGAALVPWQDNLVNINGIDYQTLGDAEGFSEWGLTLSGANGSISGTTTINLQRRGLITLDNTDRLNASNRVNAQSLVTGGNNNNRINDAASINFQQGWLKIFGGTSDNSESLATTNDAKLNLLGGTNVIDLMPTDGADTSMTLTIGEINRQAGSILQINNLDSTSKFGSTGGAESVNVLLNSIGNLVQVGNATSTTNKKVIIGLFGGIMPHEYLSDVRALAYNNGGTSDLLGQGRLQQAIAASHFMTWDSVTKVLRPLDDSEYFKPLDGLLDTLNGSVGQNVNLNEAVTIARENTSVNSLRFGPLSDNQGNNTGTSSPIHNGTMLTDMVDSHTLQLLLDGTLTIDSGMISSAYFSTGNNSTTTNNIGGFDTLIAGGTLNFGTREAIINNQNALIRSTDGVVALGNLEIRSVIAGSGGLLKTGSSPVFLDGRNTYSGVTTVSNGNLFLRNGRQSLGAGGAGNGVVIEGNGNLYAGGGIQVGSATAYEDILVKTLQANQYIMRMDTDMTNWFSNITIDNVDLAGHALFAPIIRADNSASAIINGNITGGNTTVSQDVLANTSRVVRFEAAGSNNFIFRGQFGDKTVNGKAVPISDPISTLSTIGGQRTNENEVLRVELASGSAETNYVMEQQYNAVGRLSLIQGNLIITYDPNAAGRDGTGFWTDAAMANIPDGNSSNLINSTTFAQSGGSMQQGFVMGSSTTGPANSTTGLAINNGVSSLLLTRAGQSFNMASWSTLGSGLKVIGGMNESGEVYYGNSTATGTLSISGAAVRLYSMAGGTVIFDQRLDTSLGASVSFIKTGRGTVVLKNSTGAASTSNFEIAGGTLILDHSGANVARVGSANAIFGGGAVRALSSTTANSTANYATTSAANNILNLRLGSNTEISAQGRSTSTMTVNMGNASTNNTRSNVTRGVGASLNLVEETNGIITMNFNTLVPSVQKNVIVPWATFSTTSREALDFAIVDGTASNRVKAFIRDSGHYLTDVAGFTKGMNASETSSGAFSGTLGADTVLSTLRYDSAVDSTINLGTRTLSLAGNGSAGGLLVSSNTLTANKTITGGSITANTASFSGSTTKDSRVLVVVNPTAYLSIGMPITGTGIPSGAFITAIDGNNVTISANATASGSSVNLSTATPEIMIHQYGKGTLTIDSIITGDNVLTIAGPMTTSPEQFGTTGVVKLTGDNTYTKATHVTGAVLEISKASSLGINPTSVTNGQLILNGGTFRWTGGVESLGKRGITFSGSGGVIDVVNATGNLIIGEGISGTQASIVATEIFRGDLVKMGAGTLSLLGNNSTFNALIDVREGNLVLMNDSATNTAGLTTLLGSSRSWADGTILRSGTNIQVFLGSSSDWIMEEYITFEGNNTFTYGGLLDISTTLSSTMGSIYNLGNRRPLNLNGVLDIKGTTTFDVTPTGVLLLNNAGGYLTGSGDIVKDGQGELHFRSNVPDWTGNLIIKQGSVYAANQADVIGTGAASGKRITLGSTERQGSADFLVQQIEETVQGWLFDINHNIDVIYNPSQTKRIGIEGIANGTKVNYNGDITLNDNLILLVRDVNTAVGGEQSYVNFNGRFIDGAITSGNLIVQTDDTDATPNNSVTNSATVNNTANGRSTGYAVLNGDNSGWTGDVSISDNTAFNQDTTAVLRLGNAKALTAANDVRMNYNSILQAGGNNVTIGNLSTYGGDGQFYGDAGTMSASTFGSSEIIENASATAATLSISQSTPSTYEASWDAYFRDGTLNSEFFAVGTNVLQKSAALNLTKTGTGWATLTLDNDYSGTTVVEQGILQVGRNNMGDTGALPTSGNAATLMTRVLANGTVAGTGTVQGKLMVLSGGTLKPGDAAGNSIGTLIVNGDVIFSSGSNTLMQIRNATYNNPGALTVTDESYETWRNGVFADEFSSALGDMVTSAQHDMVLATGTINWIPGTKVTLQGDGYTPKAGDIIRLFAGGTTNNAGGINVGPEIRTGGETDIPNLDLILFALGGNLRWDVSLFNSKGVLMVVEADTAVQSIAAPIITQLPQKTPAGNGKLALNTPVTLTALATTTGKPENLKYQWILNDVAVEGAISSTYNFPANSQTKGLYRVAVTNEGGITFSPAESAVMVDVDDVPDIAFNTATVQKEEGQNHTFNITVGGPPGEDGFSYEWFKDGEPITANASATQEDLVLTNLTQGDQGLYSVRVTSEYGTSISGAAFLNVRDRITQVAITQNIADTYLGQNIRLTAEHDGEGAFNYEWRRNNALFSAPNSKTIDISNAQEINKGNYTVKVTSVPGPTNFVLSAALNLDLKNPLPEIIIPPASKTVLAGTPLPMSVQATGLPLLTYVWKKNNVIQVNAFQANITKQEALLTDGGAYVVEVSNALGKATNISTKAPIKLAAEVVVVDNTKRFLPLPALGTATLTAVVGASTKAAITYQWHRVRTRLVEVEPPVEDPVGDPVIEDPVEDPGDGEEPGGETPGGEEPVDEPEFVVEEYLEDIVPGVDANITGSKAKIMKITKVVAGDFENDGDEGVYRCTVTGPDGTSITACEYELRIFTTAPDFDDTLLVGDPTNRMINFNSGLIGRDYYYQLPVKRDNPAAWPDKITASGLPPGLKVDPISGVVSGKPTATKVGGYLVTVTIANKINKKILKGYINISDLATSIPGVWVGLVDRHPAIGDNLGGRVELTVTTKSTYTGKLFLGSLTYSFSGMLDLSGSAPKGTAYIKRTGKPVPPNLKLDFTLNPSNNTLDAGTITDGDNTVAFDGWRHIFVAKATATSQPATSYAGYYTMSLGLSSDSPLLVDAGTPNVPLGAGYATFTVAADGKFKMAGKMPDGEVFTNTTFVGPMGEVAVYQHMYKALKPWGGSLLGQFGITVKPNTNQTDPPNTNNTVSGNATWVRPASLKVTDRTFRAGFGVDGAPVSTPLDVVAVGGRYNAPVLGTVVLGMPDPVIVTENNARVDFYSGGDLGMTYYITGVSTPYVSKNPDVDLAVLKGSKVTVLKNQQPVDVKTALTATAKTGLITGSFTVKDINPRFGPGATAFITRTVKFEGVIINEPIPESEGGGSQLVGVGYFLLPQLPNATAGTTDKTSPFYSGRFVFEPLP
ncbi:autotransporter-associated beta strand protein [Prosthecobacter fusiformis]|uniref:Autotransporter-associated beta strand protein n=1 Tax=Prosthecobacter fusiformis TaxID=48464 RepID=A0A4R7RTU8_9BACT|nr:autotransporter-associated beta strand repeat-containing protein [Prosthecobacter fusiformis]TDU68205.1 autotransporter-associated beta strand protein [Prosthecobacter fusiformis]